MDGIVNKKATLKTDIL